MSQKVYTHKELAGLLGISETTVKSYRRKFPGCIPVVNFGKPIRFSEEAAAVALRIRDLFATGMGVPDVRARLAAEFAWIEAEGAQAAAHPEKQDREFSPQLSLGVSNMAKSLVDMSQKQKAILNRIGSLETRLAGLGAGEEGGALQLDAGQRQNEAREREERLEARLARLDERTQSLAGSVRDLAGQLARFLGERDQAAKEWRERAPETMAEAAGLAEATRARVIPLRPEKAAAPQFAQESQPADPGRSFLSLPLMVRTEQGAYVSAGGRSRGPFCLNDLKAMLIYGFIPPEHFSLRWEAHGQGWWLFLEQEKGGRSVHMLLMELPGKDGNVAVILKLVHNGESVHPAEICAIIDSLAS